MATAPSAPGRDGLSEWLTTCDMADGVRPVDRVPASAQGMPARPAYRRRSAPGEPVALAPQQDIISLVREAGVLRWRTGTTSAVMGLRRAGGRAALPTGEVVKQFAFERLETSQVYTALVGLDRKLTPLSGSVSATDHGLRRLQGGALVPFGDPRAVADRRVLLFVHGTFSNSDAILERGLALTADGARLLADAERKYDLVLAYDHPTLSVSPMLNAFDLAAVLRPSPRQIDIVCHSRGGLVARWFCEAFADPNVVRRVVFVGSPLAGTSLAAAPRLRSALDLMTNVAEVLRAGADALSAHPLFLAASGLLRVIGTVTSLTARTPALDAAVALVPGLDAQSRTGNNEEIRRLRANTGAGDFASGQIRYFAIQANFEPRDIGWNFLRLFSKPMQRLGDLGADLIFSGENDLVVDTPSMAEVADGRAVTVAHDFGTTDRVHHTNYFVQPETPRAIRAALRIPQA